MLPPALTYDALLSYTESETERWREWFSDHPQAIAVPFGEGMFATVGDCIAHIYSVELRHSQRLLGKPVTDPNDLRPKTVEEIFGLADYARAHLREFFETATQEAFGEILTFPTLTAGVISASKHKIASNIFLHSIRHWGQIATVVRQAGFGDQWSHDYLIAAREP